MMQEFLLFTAVLFITIFLIASHPSFAETTQPNNKRICNVLVLSTDYIETWTKLTNKIIKTFNENYYHVKNIKVEDFIINPSMLKDQDMLIVIPGFSLPAITAPYITEFLKRGGDLVIFGAPIWNNDLIWDGEHFVSPIQFVRENYQSLSIYPLPIHKENIKTWKRESNNLHSPAHLKYKSIKGILPDTSLDGFQANIKELKGWDIFTTPPLDNPFPNDNLSTVFFAKGSKTTDYLTVEWREKDGSRWITSVPLSDHWQYYSLPPEKFKLWESPSRTGTSFNPKNAVKLCLGLAMSHSPIPGGKHEFWVAGLGTAPITEQQRLFISQTAGLPDIELFHPEYKFYTSEDVRYLSTNTELGLNSYTMSTPKQFLLLHPRPRGGGFNKGRSWRWIPLIHAWGKRDDYRGAISAMMIYNNEPYKSSIQICFAIQDPAWYTSNQFINYFSELTQRLQNRLFLVDGGCAFYTVFPEQELPIGATVFATDEGGYSDTSIQILMKDKNNGKVVWEGTLPLQAKTQELCQVENTIPYPKKAGDNIIVECYLMTNGEKIDYVCHELNRWKPKQKKEYITIKDGDFIYRGERWCPHGVNYMPSSGIGVAWWHYFEHWLSTEAYDPEIIQRDLERIANLGMNSISVFQYHDDIKAQNLLDLLYRADRLGLKVNLSLRPGTPFDFEWEKIREMIEFNRLPEHDEVFAYDLAWEPMFPGHEGRKRWDKNWADWVIERYGSIENAEKDWKYPIPKDEKGNITNPPDEMLTKDGKWRVMVCAYRRFLDTLLYEYYNRARMLVRSVDPYHAVSFRMTEGSNPTNNCANPLPYDWYYLSQAVDILEPEAYGRIGDWEAVKPGWFQVKYGRFCNPNIPLFWAEIGYNTYRKTPEKMQQALQFQADYFKDFYRMLSLSGSDGVYFWWYPGGYRVNEKSDYGIINPDGTYRPATYVIKKHQNVFKKQKIRPEKGEILIDRDKTSMGVHGIYELVKDNFWQSINKGKNPALISEATGTNSRTCPLIAVGNVPYNGNNPLKYLDAFFDTVVWLNDNEEKAIQNHDTIELPKGADKLKLKVTCTNLGEAEWLAGTSAHLSEGDVALYVRSGQEQYIPLTRPLKRGETFDFYFEIPVNQSTQSTSIELTMESMYRARFGPRFSFTISSK